MKNFKLIILSIVTAFFTFNCSSDSNELGQNTDENYNFFGLEIELYKIGDSKIAPNFKMICQPDNWSQSISREAKRIEQGDVSEIKLLQYK